jgi:micrococcal nuclease
VEPRDFQNRFSAVNGLIISPTLTTAMNSGTILPKNRPAKLVGVIDGDTIEILHKQHTSVSFSMVDCPENGQAYGKRAKQATPELVFGNEVALQTHGLDKYGHTLADVLLPGGTNVNHTLVKDGWGWWYRKYARGDTVMEGLEKAAREAKKGLRADPRPLLRLKEKGIPAFDCSLVRL